MDRAARDEARVGILEELGGLFRAAYAWGLWGRLLVHVAIADDGRPAVVDVAVEDIVGDEERLAAAFEGPDVRGSLPVVARAVEALTALEELDLAALGGGTFVHTPDGALAFLPGLVRSPSIAFDRIRDGVVERIVAKNAALASRFGVGRDAGVSAIEGGVVRIVRDDRVVALADAVMLGTFSRPARSFVWAAANPTLGATERKACSDLLDAMPERSCWEISTFGFATDEPTAWALTAWICDALGGDGVTAIEDPMGLVFVLLRRVREPGS